MISIRLCSARARCDTARARRERGAMPKLALTNYAAKIANYAGIKFRQKRDIMPQLCPIQIYIHYIQTYIHYIQTYTHYIQTYVQRRMVRSSAPQ